MIFYECKRQSELSFDALKNRVNEAKKSHMKNHCYTASTFKLKIVISKNDYNTLLRRVHIWARIIMYDSVSNK